MKRVVPVLLLYLCAVASAADIYNAIPDDAVAVLIATNYRDGIGTLRKCIDDCVPPSFPSGGESARLPFLKQLTELRSLLDKCEEEQGESPSDPIALVVLCGPDGETEVLALEPVAEASWQAYNAANIRQGPKGLQLVRSGKQFFFMFQGEYLVSSNDAEGIALYARYCGNPLSEQRRSSLEQLMATHNIAANVSGPALARVRGGKQTQAADLVAHQLRRLLDTLSTGVSMVPLPEKFLSAIVADYLACGDEIYMAADMTDDRIEFTGTAKVKKGGRYQTILAGQEGGAQEACALVPAKSTSAVCVSLDGEAFWSYAKGLVGSYVGGVLSDQMAIPTSLKLAQQVFDDCRARVGLGKAAVVSVMADEGRFPAPALVAEVSDAKAAVTALSNGIASLYGDLMMQSYGKQEGLYLGAPAKESVGVSGTAVKIPFAVSAADPIKAATIKDLLGTNILWRIAQIENQQRPTVIAGQFLKTESMESVISGYPGNAEEMFGDFRPDGKAIAAVFLNLPSMVSARMKAAARVMGSASSGRAAKPVAPGCVLRIYAADDGVDFDGVIPYEQVRAAYAIMTKSAPPKPVKPPKETPSDGSSEEKGSGGRRRARSGFGQPEE